MIISTDSLSFSMLTFASILSGVALAGIQSTVSPAGVRIHDVEGERERGERTEGKEGGRERERERERPACTASRVCVCACVLMCVRACVRACVRVCMRVCV